MKLAIVTGCPNGMVTSVLCARLLDAAAQRQGWSTSVEVHDPKHPERQLSAATIDEAEWVLLVSSTPLDMQRFIGKRVFQSTPAQALLQGLAAGVQDHFQALSLQAQQQIVQPLRADASGQTASHHDRVMPGSNALKGIEQGLLRLCANLRPRPVKVGDAAIVFSQLDIAAGFARHTDKGIDKTATLEQGIECLCIVLTQKATYRQRVAQIGQYLRHVQALAGSMGQHQRATVNLPRCQLPKTHGQVQCRVEGDSQNTGHQSASTKARTSSGLPTLKA